MRTQIVLGISDKDLQGKLLREDLNLDKVVRHSQATEQAEINRTLLVQENENKIDVIEKKNSNNFNSTNYHRKKQQQENVSEQFGREHSKKMSKEKSNVKTYKFNCYKCGKVHGINECPAYNRICNTCGNKNHFALMCKNKAKSENKKYEKRENNQVNTVEKENEVYEYLCLDEVEISNRYK